jgi:hypothetical protein
VKTANTITSEELEFGRAEGLAWFLRGAYRHICTNHDKGQIKTEVKLKWRTGRWVWEDKSFQ